MSVALLACQAATSRVAGETPEDVEMDPSDEQLREHDAKSSKFPSRPLTRAGTDDVVELATRNPHVDPNMATLLLRFESAFFAGWQMVLSRF